jgi:lipopolysaccharide/colanic/teichoic acid biosynthesis glycosyltransferase
MSRMPLRKRAFDLLVTLSGVALWVPLLLACALAILVSAGRPVLYVSRRRIFRKESARIPKLRTMVRGAEGLVNRDTVPIAEVRFLNIPLESRVFTPVGRWIERYQFTELPQLFLVLSGQLSIVGARPLPENVISALREAFPYVEDRFIAVGGMMGPAQLVGRAVISDEDRLMLEIAYGQLSVTAYSIVRDVRIIFNTVLVQFGLRRPFSVNEAAALLQRDTPSSRVLGAARGPGSQSVTASTGAATGWVKGQES